MLNNIYGPLLMLHGTWEWVVLATAAAAIAVSATGWIKQSPWSVGARRAGLIFTIALDIQVLLGLALYCGASPLVRAAWQNMAAAMKQHELRFFAVEHVTMMLGALVLAHLGAILARKAASDLGKYRRATIFYALSLILILGGIPWWRPMLRILQ